MEIKKITEFFVEDKKYKGKPLTSIQNSFGGGSKEAMTIELLVLTLLVFIASAIGTFSGFGTSTIIVPVTFLFVGVIHWFGDI